MLEHAPLSYYISNAFGSNNCDRVSAPVHLSSSLFCSIAGRKADGFVRTLIFTDVFQSEGKRSVFPLDDSDFAKCATTDDSK